MEREAHDPLRVLDEIPIDLLLELHRRARRMPELLRLNIVEHPTDASPPHTLLEVLAWVRLLIVRDSDPWNEDPLLLADAPKVARDELTLRSGALARGRVAVAEGKAVAAGDSRREEGPGFERDDAVPARIYGERERSPPSDKICRVDVPVEKLADAVTELTEHVDAWPKREAWGEGRQRVATGGDEKQGESYSPSMERVTQSDRRRARDECQLVVKGGLQEKGI